METLEQTLSLEQEQVRQQQDQKRINEIMLALRQRVEQNDRLLNCQDN